MVEIQALRIAMVGVIFTEEMREIAEEYHLEIMQIDSKDNSSIIRELRDFTPDVVLATNNFLSLVYSNVPQKNRPSIFLAVNEEVKEFPTVLDAGIADDVIVLPIRRFEFLNRLRWHFHLHALRSIEGLNSSVTRLIHKLEEDIVLAQKIQRRLIKDRFPPMAGLSIKSKYWCGLRSGGDYFDVFEFEDKVHVGFLLCDVSSYKLSSAFLSAMMHLPAELKADEMKDPSATVSKIFLNLKEQMEEKDSLSIFYGVLDRKSLVLRYVTFGKIFVQLQSMDGRKNWICKGDREPLLSTSENKLLVEKAHEIAFEPEDRLYLISDGIEEGIASPISAFLDKLGDRDPQAVVNELAFALRTKQDPDGSESAEGEYPMPPQDCSIVLIDVAKNVLRLAR